MNVIRNGVVHCALAFVVTTLSMPTCAQMVRTWVSALGDDLNPCHRTLPCRTFAAAIAKTSVNGEINVIDAGQYGPLTITKSIIIDGKGFEAGILAPMSATGIVVDITPSASDPTPRVILRNLDIHGVGTGIKGIRVLGTQSVLVQDVTITGFFQQGIDFSPAGSSDLTLSRVTIRQMGAAGVLFDPAPPAVVVGNILDSVLDGNRRGVHVGNGSTVSITRTSMSGNSEAGITVGALARAADAMLDNVTVVGNGVAGVAVNGEFAIGRLSNSTIFGNPVALQVSNGAQLFSYRTNRLDGNFNGVGSLTSPAGLQ